MSLPISRRQLIGVAIGGIGGGAWSAGFLWATRVDSPRLEVIGIDATQLILLDTTAERVLIVAGPHHERMLDTLPDMLGALRHRIDILFASESALHMGAESIRDRWNVGRTFALPEVASNLSPSADIAVVQPLDVTLSHGVSLRCIPHRRYAQSALGSDPGWRIEIQRGSQIIGIASSFEILSSVPAGPYGLAIAPSGSIQLAERKSLAASYGVNEWNIQDSVISTTQVRIFERDVAEFTIGNDSIGLPDWTTGADRSS